MMLDIPKLISAIDEQKPGIIFSVAFAILIGLLITSLSYPQLGEMLSGKNANAVLVELPEKEHKIDISDLEEQITQYMGIPDYYADIHVNFDSPIVYTDEKVNFIIEVMDRSIPELANPYFYVFIVDPDTKIRMSFPEMDASGYPRHMKWNKWGEKICGFTVDGVEDQCIRRELFFPKDDSDQRVKFSFKPEETTGTWEVYVFLFDEEYEPRKYGIYGESIEEYKDNAIVSVHDTFDFKSGYRQSEPNIIWIILRFLVTTVVSAGGLSYIFIKKIDTKKHKRCLIAIWVLVSIVLLFLLGWI